MLVEHGLTSVARGIVSSSSFRLLPPLPCYQTSQYCLHSFVDHQDITLAMLVLLEGQEEGRSGCECILCLMVFLVFFHLLQTLVVGKLLSVSREIQKPIR